MNGLAGQLARYEEIVRGKGDPLAPVPPSYRRGEVVEAMRSHGVYPAEDAITWFVWSCQAPDRSGGEEPLGRRIGSIPNAHRATS